MSIGKLVEYGLVFQFLTEIEFVTFLNCLLLGMGGGGRGISVSVGPFYVFYVSVVSTYKYVVSVCMDTIDTNITPRPAVISPVSTGPI